MTFGNQSFKFIPELLYEDEDVLAINKPAGVRVDQITEWLLTEYSKGRLAHRLDKDTTGVLLLAKSESSYEYLKNLFQTRQIKKTYWALVYGEFKKEEGSIDWPIGRSRKDPRRRIALPPEKHHEKSVGNKWREALTKYKVLEKFGSYTLAEVSPKTGRTHQVRVHLKALGYPIVCDALYASGKICPDGLNRQALHAKKLEFVTKSGQALELEADLPEDFKKALIGLRGL